MGKRKSASIDNYSTNKKVKGSTPHQPEALSQDTEVNKSPHANSRGRQNLVQKKKETAEAPPSRPLLRDDEVKQEPPDKDSTKVEDERDVPERKKTRGRPPKRAAPPPREPAPKRPRGRPPKKAIREVKEELEDADDEEDVPPEAPEAPPEPQKKNGRGRKSKKVAVEVERGIKMEVDEDVVVPPKKQKPQKKYRRPGLEYDFPRDHHEQFTQIDIVVMKTAYKDLDTKGRRKHTLLMKRLGKYIADDLNPEHEDLRELTLNPAKKPSKPSRREIIVTEGLRPEAVKEAVNNRKFGKRRRAPTLPPPQKKITTAKATWSKKKPQMVLVASTVKKRPGRPRKNPLPVVVKAQTTRILKSAISQTEDDDNSSDDLPCTPTPAKKPRKKTANVAEFMMKTRSQDVKTNQSFPNTTITEIPTENRFTDMTEVQTDVEMEKPAESVEDSMEIDDSGYRDVDYGDPVLRQADEERPIEDDIEQTEHFERMDYEDERGEDNSKEDLGDNERVVSCLAPPVDEKNLTVNTSKKALENVPANEPEKEAEKFNILEAVSAALIEEEEELENSISDDDDVSKKLGENIRPSNSEQLERNDKEEEGESGKSKGVPQQESVDSRGNENDKTRKELLNVVSEQPTEERPSENGSLPNVQPPVITITNSIESVCNDDLDKKRLDETMAWFRAMTREGCRARRQKQIERKKANEREEQELEERWIREAAEQAQKEQEQEALVAANQEAEDHRHEWSDVRKKHWNKRRSSSAFTRSSNDNRRRWSNNNSRYNGYDSSERGRRLGEGSRSPQNRSHSSSYNRLSDESRSHRGDRGRSYNDFHGDEDRSLVPQPRSSSSYNSRPSEKGYGDWGANQSYGYSNNNSYDDGHRHDERPPIQPSRPYSFSSNRYNCFPDESNSQRSDGNDQGHRQDLSSPILHQRSYSAQYNGHPEESRSHGSDSQSYGYYNSYEDSHSHDGISRSQQSRSSYRYNRSYDESYSQLGDSRLYNDEGHRNDDTDQLRSSSYFSHSDESRRRDSRFNGRNRYYADDLSEENRGHRSDNGWSNDDGHRHDASYSVTQQISVSYHYNRFPDESRSHRSLSLSNGRNRYDGGYDHAEENRNRSDNRRSYNDGHMDNDTAQLRSSSTSSHYNRRSDESRSHRSASRSYGQNSDDGGRQRDEGSYGYQLSSSSDYNRVEENRSRSRSYNEGHRYDDTTQLRSSSLYNSRSEDIRSYRSDNRWQYNDRHRDDDMAQISRSSSHYNRYSGESHNQWDNNRGSNYSRSRSERYCRDKDRYRQPETNSDDVMLTPSYVPLPTVPHFMCNCGKCYFAEFEISRRNRLENRPETGCRYAQPRIPISDDGPEIFTID